MQTTFTFTLLYFLCHHLFILCIVWFCNIDLIKELEVHLRIFNNRVISSQLYYSFCLTKQLFKHAHFAYNWLQYIKTDKRANVVSTNCFLIVFHKLTYAISTHYLNRHIVYVKCHNAFWFPACEVRWLHRRRLNRFANVSIRDWFLISYFFENWWMHFSNNFKFEAYSSLFLSTLWNSHCFVVRNCVLIA